MSISDLHTPAAIVDLDRLEANIKRMASKTERFGVALRPHIKTHKCIEIGEMQEKAGAIGITVSTLTEAFAFANAGFQDITYAVPITPNKMRKALTLAERVKLTLLVDHGSTVKKLAASAGGLGTSIDVMLKVDCGYHRCGVDPESRTALHLAQHIDNEEALDFAGILTHAGHSYNASNHDQVKEIAKREQQVMVDFARTLRNEGVECPTVSVGSTPTISASEEIIEGITEVRPGNYVFYDWTQVVLGSCRVSDCAFTILSAVVGSYGDHIVIDAGATGLSKDTGAVHLTGGDGFGRIFQEYDQDSFVQSAKISSLSQEHGKVKDIHFQAGDMVRILPNHSCLTANLYDYCHVARGDEVVAVWKVQNGKTTPD